MKAESMNKYLITHEAVVGRTKEEGAQIAPITLLFYSMVEAPSAEAANEQAVVYRDPGFRTTVLGVSEVADQLSADDLYALLDHKKVLVESTL